MKAGDRRRVLHPLASPADPDNVLLPRELIAIVSVDRESQLASVVDDTGFERLITFAELEQHTMPVPGVRGLQ